MLKNSGRNQRSQHGRGCSHSPRAAQPLLPALICTKNLHDSVDGLINNVGNLEITHVSSRLGRGNQTETHLHHVFYSGEREARRGFSRDRTRTTQVLLREAKLRWAWVCLSGIPALWETEGFQVQDHTRQLDEIITKQKWKGWGIGAGGIAQQLSALAALSEDCHL